ncbi:MAG TPA: cob(I)yrinic acid a,c-diamide adenosyltransferase [Bryobacteraceae bacterium]|nr:cob(I)yrinic acid a,c-diamide adenosyltransferase [Bryobacteraceae bacterium]
MDKKIFNEPRLSLNRIYTKSGDKGETGLVGGKRVPKDSLRIECYGTIDELISFLGQAGVSASKEPALAPLSSIILRLQHELFNLGSILATPPEIVHEKQPRVTNVEVEQLEREIDSFNQGLGRLRSFTLPGGSRINADLHVCRTVCRRAERLTIALSREESIPGEAIPYLNRLSDALFVFSRWASQATGSAEILWQPNKAASGQL